MIDENDGIPSNNTPVGREWKSSKRRMTEVCTFRMLPSTARKWSKFARTVCETPSAVANALVRDLLNDRIMFRTDSATRILMEKSGAFGNARAMSEYEEE